MMPMKDFGWVERDLTQRFENGMLRKPASLVALIFSRPDCVLAKGEILPAIDYFNERGNNTVFYFAGYDPDEVKAAGPEIKGPGNESWYFNAQAFNQFRADVETQTKWKYSGGSDMILTNARYEMVGDYMQGRIDFSHVMLLQLDKLKEISTAQTVGELFEQIFQFAENQSALSTDPVWEFSDKSGLRVAKHSLKSLILSFLPKALQDEAKGAFHLVVSDISKAQVATP